MWCNTIGSASTVTAQAAPLRRGGRCRTMAVAAPSRPLMASSRGRVWRDRGDDVVNLECDTLVPSGWGEERWQRQEPDGLRAPSVCCRSRGP